MNERDEKKFDSHCIHGSADANMAYGSEVINKQSCSGTKGESDSLHCGTGERNRRREKAKATGFYWEEEVHKMRARLANVHPNDLHMNEAWNTLWNHTEKTSSVALSLKLSGTLYDTNTIEIFINTQTHTQKHSPNWGCLNNFCAAE